MPMVFVAWRLRARAWLRAADAGQGFDARGGCRYGHKSLQQKRKERNCAESNACSH
jgi:hypothetical protein